MKVVLNTILLFSVMQVNASDLTCEDQAKRYSSKITDNSINALDIECLKKAFSNGRSSTEISKNYLNTENSTRPHLVDIKADIEKSIYANDNYVIFKDSSSKVKTYSGTKTKFSNIHSISLSNKGDFFAVLNERDEKKEILIFKTSFSGNVSPYKVIEMNEETVNTSRISFNHKGKFIIMFNQVSKSVYSVNMDKDSRKIASIFKPSFIKVHTFEEKVNPVVIKSIKGSFLVFSKNVLYSYSDDFLQKAWEMDLGEIGLNGPKGMQLSQDGKTLEIYNQENALVSINLPE